MGRKPDQAVDQRLRDNLIEEIDACSTGRDVGKLLGLDESGIEADHWSDMFDDILMARDENGLEAMVDTAIRKMSPAAYQRARHRATVQLSRERKQRASRGYDPSPDVATPSVASGRALVDLDLKAIELLDQAAQRLKVSRSDAIRQLVQGKVS